MYVYIIHMYIHTVFNVRIVSKRTLHLTNKPSTIILISSISLFHMQLAQILKRISETKQKNFIKYTIFISYEKKTETSNICAEE